MAIRTRAFLSPTGGGWYDGPNDPGRDFVGRDIAAQAEARRVLAASSPFPFVDVPVRGLTGDAAYALRVGLMRLVESL